MAESTAANPAETARVVPAVFATCENCAQSVPTANITLHELHCRRRIHRCPHCSECMPIENADVHIREAVGNQDLIVDALKVGNIDLIQNSLLHTDGQTAKWRFGDNFESLLHMAVRDCSSTKMSIDSRGMRIALVRELIEKHDCDVNEQDTAGRTLLHHAAQAGAADLVRLLLRAGADVHARNKMGDSVLSIASGEQTRQELLQAGATLRQTSTTSGPSRLKTPLNRPLSMPQPQATPLPSLRPEPRAASASRHVRRLRATVGAAVPSEDQRFSTKR